MSDERTVTFDFEGSEVLRESDIWPDKDAPRNWNAEDVLALLKRGWLESWNMADCITVTITDDHGLQVETKKL